MRASLRALSLALVLAAVACSKADGEKGGGGETGASSPGRSPPPVSAAPSEDDEKTAGDAAIQQIDAFIAEKPPDKEAPGWKTRLRKPPVLEFVEGAKYFWHLDTNKGTMKIFLDPKIAPIHVSNFIYLTRLGFYDGLGFHRVIGGFMAQGGCPRGDGAGDPGYKIRTETPAGPKHDRRGIVSTARSPQRDTDGAQFFIMFKANRGLDGNYSIFGEVVEGKATIDGLEAAADPRADNGVPPREKLTIRRAWITVE